MPVNTRTPVLLDLTAYTIPVSLDLVVAETLPTELTFELVPVRVRFDAETIIISPSQL